VVEQGARGLAADAASGADDQGNPVHLIFPWFCR
jgi:hypothetical protein